jgi:RNA polymerase-associated protein
MQMGVVAKRSSMTLFSGGVDQYSHRVRMVLAEKGVTVDIIDVDSGNKPDELLELNPYGSIPTLLDRDLVLYESPVIMEYLDERFPHPPLLPVYPVARALSRLWVRRIQRDWCDDLDILLAGKGGEAKLGKARKSLRESLIAVAPIFAEKPFFMSDDFTLVDCIVAPVLWRLELVGIDLPEKQTRALMKYSERLFDRDGFQASLTEHEQEMRD